MNIKHLLYGVAVIAALAVSAPAWAQTAGGNSYGGNSMGIPGPNPGGPETPGTINGGLFGHTPSPAPASTSAMPPTHHHAYHVTHAAAHHRKIARLTLSTANQLNQEERARLQSGSSMPPLQGPMGAMPPPAWLPSRSGGEQYGTAWSEPGRTGPDAL
jgi:hypothetical protein